MATIQNQLVTHVIELMQLMGPVSARRMFGGYGFFLDGLMFALMADDILYLKADAETIEDFAHRNLEAFSYQKQGKKYSMSYYCAPEEVFENSGDMSLWVNKAYEVALRAAARKRGG